MFPREPLTLVQFGRAGARPLRSRLQAHHPSLTRLAVSGTAGDGADRDVARGRRDPGPSLGRRRRPAGHGARVEYPRRQGLEAEHVLIIDAHKLARLDDDSARRLLYIGMTRARSGLTVMSVGSAPLLSRLANVVARGGSALSQNS